MVWDTTPQTWRAWQKSQSAEYEDSVNASVMHPVPVHLLGVLSESVEQLMPRTATSDSETSSLTLHVDVETPLKAAGKGPYPEVMKALAGASRKRAGMPRAAGKRSSRGSR